MSHIDVYYIGMGLVYLGFHCFLAVVLGLSVWKKVSAGLVFLLLASLASLIPSAGNLFLTIVRVTHQVGDFKEALEASFVLIAIFEPVAIVLMFVGILILAIRNYREGCAGLECVG